MILTLALAQAAIPTTQHPVPALVQLVLVLILAVAAFGIYFLPSIVARKRKHPSATAITVLNLLLGWTLLGWVGALVWAFTNNSTHVVPNGTNATDESPTRKCPFCAESVRVEATKCKHCGSDIFPTAAQS